MLHVHIHADFENTFVELRHPAPVPKGLAVALQYAKLLAHRARAKAPVSWDFVEVGSALVARAHFQGIWALDPVLGWCAELAEDVGRCLSIFACAPQSAAAYPLALHFNGVSASSVAEMERMALALGARAYELGVFQLSQPVLRVSDPCYEPDTWCAQTLEVLPGAWHAKVLLTQTSWHRRVARLQIHHHSLGRSLELLPPASLEVLPESCGVDSSQCGFFDDAYYPREKAQFDFLKETFYGRCCALTGAPEHPGGGVLDGHGVVTRAGLGDGLYTVGVQRNNAGEVVVVSLLYCDAQVPD